MPKPSIRQVYFKNSKNDFTKLPSKNKTNRLQILAVAVIVVSGLASGYLLAQHQTGAKTILPNGGKPQFVKSEKIVGTTAREFKDSAVGVLEAGGLDGEGTHKLIREGGPSQTAYLTSSIIDLDKYVGSKIKVFGETFKAQKAGWLMDVGRLEILE